MPEGEQAGPLRLVCMTAQLPICSVLRPAHTHIRYREFLAQTHALRVLKPPSRLSPRHVFHRAEYFTQPCGGKRILGILSDLFPE